jgi:hypothetical protein
MTRVVKSMTDCAEAAMVLVPAVPFHRFLGMREEVVEGETRYLMDFCENHVGNPLIRTFHGLEKWSRRPILHDPWRGSSYLLARRLPSITCDRLSPARFARCPTLCGRDDVSQRSRCSCAWTISWRALGASCFPWGLQTWEAARDPRSRHDWFTNQN